MVIGSSSVIKENAARLIENMDDHGAPNALHNDVNQPSGTIGG